MFGAEGAAEAAAEKTFEPGEGLAEAEAPAPDQAAAADTEMEAAPGTEEAEAAAPQPQPSVRKGPSPEEITAIKVLPLLEQINSKTLRGNSCGKLRGLVASRRAY